MGSSISRAICAFNKAITIGITTYNYAFKNNKTIINLVPNEYFTLYNTKTNTALDGVIMFNKINNEIHFYYSKDGIMNKFQYDTNKKSYTYKYLNIINTSDGYYELNVNN